MTLIALVGVLIFGILLGLLLFLTDKGGIWENRFAYMVTASIVNVFRAIPFIILIFLIFPFTIFIVGTIRGPNAALPALIIGGAPFYARLVEIALREVDQGVIEAAQSMGAKTRTIIFKVLLSESLPALISGLTVTAIALIGYTAMAGVIGAGGLETMLIMQVFNVEIFPFCLFVPYSLLLLSSFFSLLVIILREK